MKAVIMAGGEGTRLRPLTSLRPKPMVPIVNQPVMEHIVGLVKHHGITEIVATLAFMPQAISDYFGDGDEWGVTIEYAIEEVPLGTAGSVKNAEKLLAGDEPFVVISGDALTDIDLGELVEYHKRMGGAVTIALKRVDDPLDFGVVITAERRPDRALLGEAHVGAGLQRPHQHRHLRRGAVGARRDPRRGPLRLLGRPVPEADGEGPRALRLHRRGLLVRRGQSRQLPRRAPRHSRRQGEDLRARRACARGRLGRGKRGDRSGRTTRRQGGHRRQRQGARGCLRG